MCSGYERFIASDRRKNDTLTTAVVMLYGIKSSLEDEKIILISRR